MLRDLKFFLKRFPAHNYWLL